MFDNKKIELKLGQIVNIINLGNFVFLLEGFGFCLVFMFYFVIFFGLLAK